MEIITHSINLVTILQTDDPKDGDNKNDTQSRFVIKIHEANLTRERTVLLGLVRTIDQKRIISKIGNLESQRAKELIEKLSSFLGTFVE